MHALEARDEQDEGGLMHRTKTKKKGRMESIIGVSDIIFSC